MVKLGGAVKDSITGFVGIAIGRAEYLNGCISCQVQDLKDITKTEWIDEQRLTIYSQATAGGPQSRPPAMHP